MSKAAILSIATGLSFISIFAILSMILIPIIDSVKHNSNVDYRINIIKLKKDLLEELLNYKSTTYRHLNNDEINHLYDKLTNKLSVLNTFEYIIYIMRFINFDNIVSENNENYINKNIFVPQYVSNTIIIGQTGSSKTNLLFNMLTLNPVFQKIFIFTKEPEAKYNFLIKKFPQDIRICYQNDEYDLDKLIKGDLQTCCIFDDQLSDNEKISDWFIRSRKKIVQIYFHLIRILK